MSNKSTKELELVTVHELFKGRAKAVPNVKSFSASDTHGPAKTIAVVNQKVALVKPRQQSVLGLHLQNLAAEFCWLILTHKDPYQLDSV